MTRKGKEEGRGRFLTAKLSPNSKELFFEKSEEKFKNILTNPKT